LDPASALGAPLHLARLRGGRLEAMPPTYISTLFDQYAPRFDAHLVGALNYRGPEIIIAALDQFHPGRRFGRALDLGCGTGLMAKVLGARAESIDGIDLSPRMIDEARQSSLYDDLQVTSLADFLNEPGCGPYDLVLAADVFVYVGALTPLLNYVAEVLAPGGMLAFTLQSSGGADFDLGADMRFSHAPAYVRRALDAAGMAPVVMEPRSSRRERGTDVPGLVVVATKS
jgi:predicted TPR repeat methyltransferase